MPQPIPLIVNLFGSPGSGKSTLAALIYAACKTRHSDLVVELATEFAKDLVWEGRELALKNQSYVLGEQAQRIERVIGKADVVITDSPVLLSCIYRPIEYPGSFDDFTLWLHSQYPSMNVMVRRPATTFEREGRIHSEAQSRIIDHRIRALFAQHAIPFSEASPEPGDAERITATIADLVQQPGFFAATTGTGAGNPERQRREGNSN